MVVLCRRSPIRSEAGSGSTLALAIIAATAALSLTLITAIGAFAVHTRASVAADAAALAAADTASGRLPGDPCGRASLIAAAHDASLASCDSSRTESVVTVTTEFGWFTVAATARAGLPR